MLPLAFDHWQHVCQISNKSYVNLDKVSLKKMKLPPVYIPYIHFFCVNYAGYDLLYSIICDIKEIAKEAKIR